MSHDKIKAAARERVAETGEPYAAARRAVIREQQERAASRNPAPGARWLRRRLGEQAFGLAGRPAVPCWPASTGRGG
jgi:hypothetical protein